MSVNRIICDNCGMRQGIDIAKLSACSKCNKDKYVAYYCNESCQREAYTNHHRYLCSGRRRYDGGDGAPCYSIQPIPGKGNGLIATRPIKRGEIILVESPVLKIMHVSEYELSMDDIRTQYDALNSETRDELLKLYIAQKHEKTPENDIYDKVKKIVRSNGFRETEYDDDDCTLAKASYSVVFLNRSRFNHSCTPNATAISPQNGKHFIPCVRDIAIGEEITLSYCNVKQKRDDRRRKLYQDYSFLCNCETCVLTGAQQALSDSRRAALAVEPHTVSQALPRIAMAKEEKLMDSVYCEAVVASMILVGMTQQYHPLHRKLMVDCWHGAELIYGSDNFQSQDFKAELYNDKYWA